MTIGNQSAMKLLNNFNYVKHFKSHVLNFFLVQDILQAVVSFYVFSNVIPVSILCVNSSE